MDRNPVSLSGHHTTPDEETSNVLKRIWEGDVLLTPPPRVLLIGARTPRFHCIGSSGNNSVEPMKAGSRTSICDAGEDTTTGLTNA